MGYSPQGHEESDMTEYTCKFPMVEKVLGLKVPGD